MEVMNFVIFRDFSGVFFEFFWILNEFLRIFQH